MKKTTRKIYEENEEIEREKTELGKFLKKSQEKSIFIQYYYHNLHECSGSEDAESSETNYEGEITKAEL